MKKLLLLALFPLLSMGAISTNDKYLLNNKAGAIPHKVQLGTLLGNADTTRATLNSLITAYTALLAKLNADAGVTDVDYGTGATAAPPTLP